MVDVDTKAESARFGRRSCEELPTLTQREVERRLPRDLWPAAAQAADTTYATFALPT